MSSGENVAHLPKSSGHHSTERLNNNQLNALLPFPRINKIIRWNLLEHT